VGKMVSRGYPLLTEESADFLERYIFKNLVSVLEHF